jgi:hypothetical protein
MRPLVFVHTRVPHLTLSVIFASKYKVSVVLGQFREILGKKWSAGWGVYSAVCKSLCPGWDIIFNSHSGVWSPYWVHSARRPLNGLLYQPRVIVIMMENLVE